jgi:UDP:flavonoid glycosyltransferase YjiC (YdhE family)
VRVLFSFTGGEGHLQPLLPLALAAAGAGHQVLVAGAASLGRVAGAAGVPFRAAGPDVVPQHVPLTPVDMDREARAVTDAFAGWMARDRAAALVPLCEEWRPDVLVRDEMDFGAAVAAECVGIPHASVLVLAAGGFVTADLIGEPLDALRAEHGLPPDPGLEMPTRHLVLSPFAPSFRDPANRLPGTAQGFRATRPLDHLRRPAVLDRLSGAPVVYVTLGTIFNTESGDLFDRVIAGVRGLPVDVVVTTGRAVDPASLGPQPANVHVEQYVAQSLLLPRSTAVISHAGSGSITGALEQGLPVVCIPMGADQPLNAARCSALGVGPTLDAMTLTPGDVAAAASAILTDPSYRAAAGRVQAEIAALPPASYAVGLLERLATGEACTPRAAGAR